jgi:hypothetical protein
VTKEELENVALESTRTVEIDEFVAREEIDPRYIIRPYYLRPDGKVGHDAFAVIRETIRKMNKAAIGRVVLTNHEHIIALEPLDKGLIGTLLRYPYEVRAEDEYFDEIQDVKVTKDKLDLAKHSRRQNTALQLVLAKQCFGAYDRTITRSHLGLKVQEELLIRDVSLDPLTFQETIMGQLLRAGAITIAVFGSVGIAAAQRSPGTTQADLTPAQERMVSQGLASSPTTAVSMGAPSRSAAARNRSGSGLACLT